jgi:hypothetical protein
MEHKEVLKDKKLKKVLDNFTKRMEERLIQKGNNAHFTGWDNKDNLLNFKKRFFKKLNNFLLDDISGQAIDLANFIMMIDYLKSGKPPFRKRKEETMNNIQKALEEIKNKHIEYKDNYHGGTGIYYYRGYINDLEQLIESLYNIVEGVDVPTSSKDDYTWGYRVAKADLKQEILSGFNNKLGIEDKTNGSSKQR